VTIERGDKEPELEAGSWKREKLTPDVTAYGAGNPGGAKWLFLLEFGLFLRHRLCDGVI
jgi:hypothetical protein